MLIYTNLDLFENVSNIRVSVTYVYVWVILGEKNLMYKSDAFCIRVTSGMLLSVLCCYLTLANERFSETPSHMENRALEQVSEVTRLQVVKSQFNLSHHTALSLVA